ncbi:hypothetical protein [Microbulbifer sp. S227A]|uniref:hypothetical protein n=1 Tax=Microbulbifer sp. S227A TaxID=3415131 RepID=UPI003C7E0CC2
MNQSQIQFEQRLYRLNQKYESMTQGGSSVRQQDGLVLAGPMRIRPRTAIRPYLMLAVLFVLFKAVLIAAAGQGTYDGRIAQLRQGNPVEHAGAVVMQADPVSQFLAHRLRPLLH